MEARARAKYIRIAPRKSRLVIDMIRGKSAAEAATILTFSTRAASKAVLKVLNSAVANAVQKGTADPETLIVAEAYADEGPTLKRWRPRAHGRASRINKRSSHITIVLTGEDKKKPVKKEAKETPEKTEVASSPKKKKAPHLPAGKAGNDAKRAKVIPVKKSKAVKPKKTIKPEEKPASAEEAGKKEGLSGSEG
ncbi:MAG: 50S ribosomal protein L22 [Actinomycetota bacterium]